MTPPPPALLLLGLGPRDEAAAHALESFARGLADRNSATPVACGFTGASAPPPEGFAAGRAAGVAAVPLSLVCTQRAKDDALAALARATSGDAGVPYACARPPGPHPELLSVLERRVEEAQEGSAGTGGRGPNSAARSPRDRAGTTVLLVGEGSTDPEANAEVHKAARLLWEGRGYAGVEAAFVSRAAPDVASGLDRCRKLGAKRVVVLPYFLFAGAPAERARMHAEGWSLANPEVEVFSAEVVGATQELAEVVLERYREAAASLERPAASSAEAPADGSGHDEEPGGHRDAHGQAHPHDHDGLPHGGDGDARV